MKKHRYLPRVLAAAMSAAFLSGCASSGPQQDLKGELQYPHLTPKEQWSDAMTILIDDMSIAGQTDRPKARAHERELVVAQVRRLIGASNDPLYGATLATTGAYSPPTGVSSGAAVGIGLAMAVIPTAAAAGPLKFSQLVAWVPASEAGSMAEAVDLAASNWQSAREGTFGKLTQLKAKPSKYQEGNKQAQQKLADIAKQTVIAPDGPATKGPSFLPAGSYYGPIFFQGFDTQILVDAGKADMTRNEAMVSASKKLPPYFAMYFPGQIPQYNKGETPPSIIIAGKELPFVGN